MGWDAFVFGVIVGVVIERVVTPIINSPKQPLSASPEEQS